MTTQHEQNHSLQQALPTGNTSTLGSPTERNVASLFEGDASADERRIVLDKLFFNRKQGWKTPYWLMLALSAGIATLGLSENSAATVIGAMIIAPLGQPIVALGAAVAIGWPRQCLRMLILIVTGAVTAVVIAFFLGLLLPHSTPDEQVLSRTTPDIRDFGIAVFAGIAGAYGFYRKEFSAVLAGVAIAVALVPPLAVIGLMLEEGRYSLACGALLLFLTNLIGISIAATLTAFFTGVAKYQSLTERRVLISLILTVLVGIAVMVPLVANYDRIVNPAAQEARYHQLAGQTLRKQPEKITLESLRTDGAHAIVVISIDDNKLHDVAGLKAQLQEALGLQTQLVVRDTRK